MSSISSFTKDGSANSTGDRTSTGTEERTPNSTQNETKQTISFYTEICGGLGNQLFQLFAAHAVAASTRETKNKNSTTLILRSPFSWSILHQRSVYWDTMFSKIQTIPKCPVIHYVHNDIEAIHGYEPIIFPTQYNEHVVQLKGCYQHRAHFWKERNSLIRDLLPDSLTWQSWQPLQRISQSHDFGKLGFLHIRRGDYKKLTHCHFVLSMQYYENAIQYYDATIKFLVFCESEDVEQVKNECARSPKLRDRVIADGLLIRDVPDYQQLYLMSICGRGGMIANSTFSVWAGYLHAAKTGIFTYPDIFFTEHPGKLPSIFDPTWICVPAKTPFVRRSPLAKPKPK